MLSWVGGVALLAELAVPMGGTDGDWRYVRPHKEIADAVLSNVTMPTRDQGWAAGSRGSAPLLLSWNGTRWNERPAPFPADTMVEGLDAASPGNAWLVGSGPDGVPRVARHGGSGWSAVKLPIPGPSFPRDVDTLPSGQTWITGSASGFAGNTATIWHWDGRAWRTASVTARPGAHSELTAVSARTESDVWAAGTRGFRPVRQLLLHWDGRTWTETTPPALRAESTLADVTATASGQAWAVGSIKASDGADIPLVQRWNGRTWTVVRPPVARGRLYTVTGDGSSGIWAAGEDARARPLLAHYDDAGWRVPAIPTPCDMPAAIRALTTTPHLWAAGSYHHSSDHALTWTNTPRPR
jgi:hypothetical protein